jgi:hypothetical protein
LVTLSRPAECRTILTSGSLDAAHEQKSKKKNNAQAGQKSGKAEVFSRTAPEAISRLTYQKVSFQPGE